MVRPSQLAVGIFAAGLPLVKAGFSASSTKNVAVYWGKSVHVPCLCVTLANKSQPGQNSYNQASGPYVQERLSYYCQSKPNVLIWQTNQDIDILA
jgi:hypothetical protein